MAPANSKVDTKPTTTKQAPKQAAKPAPAKKAENKPAENKKAPTKPAQKAVQPKKKVANENEKKDNKPVTTVPPTKQQKNEKRKREENGTAPVHDVEKKMKESEPGVVTVGKRLIFADIPENSTVEDFELLFQNFDDKPQIKILSYHNKERVGDAHVVFRNEDAFNQALNIGEFVVQGKTIKPFHDDLPKVEDRTIYLPYLGHNFDNSDIIQFFDGIEIERITHISSNSGRLMGKAYVVFTSTEGRDAALEKNKEKMKDVKINVVKYSSTARAKPKLPKKVKTQPKAKAPQPKAKAPQQPKATPKQKKQAKDSNNATMDVTPDVKVPQQKPAPKNPNQNKAASKNANPNQNKPAPKNPNQNQNKAANGKKPAEKAAAGQQKQNNKKAQKKN